MWRHADLPRGKDDEISWKELSIYNLNNISNHYMFPQQMLPYSVPQHWKYTKTIWASSLENLSSGAPKKWDSNQPA